MQKERKYNFDKSGALNDAYSFSELRSKLMLKLLICLFSLIFNQQIL